LKIPASVPCPTFDLHGIRCLPCRHSDIGNLHKIVKLTAVKENKFKEKTIEIKFEQICEGRKHKLMMLTIKNPFSKDLNYGAGIYLMNNKKWVSTSVLPVLAGKVAFETWPDIIVSIALNNFTLE
jgi:hypothetical protein